MSKAVDEAAAQRAVFDGKPIEVNGLQLWGISMGQYEKWMNCKNVWLARQSTFPVFCVSMSFLDAIFALDMDAIQRTGKPAGFLYAIMYALGLALGFDDNCVRDGNIYIKTKDGEDKELEAIVVRTGKENIAITPQRFPKIRKIVAWMQGDTLPDETLNDELLDTEKTLSERNAPPLNYSLLDLEASVALACGVRVKDVADWPILEFETMRRAIDRGKKHLICGIGENNGCKWEGGNPYPSWCFDKIEKASRALIARDQFGKSKK